MLTIRQATMDDLQVLLAMGAEMHPTCSFAHLRFDARHFGNFLVQLIAGDEHAIFLAEQGDQVAGALLASCVPASISPDLVACEHAFFVRPAHRASRAALSLLKAYMAWAKDKGAKRVNAGNSAGMDDARYVRLLERAGFTRAGSLMFTNL